VDADARPAARHSANGVVLAGPSLAQWIDAMSQSLPLLAYAGLVLGLGIVVRVLAHRMATELGGLAEVRRERSFEGDRKATSLADWLARRTGRRRNG
jgi:hypothetical protein